MPKPGRYASARAILCQEALARAKREQLEKSALRGSRAHIFSIEAFCQHSDSLALISRTNRGGFAKINLRGALSLFKMGSRSHSAHLVGIYACAGPVTIFERRATRAGSLLIITACVRLCVCVRLAGKSALVRLAKTHFAL
jgi:hypothetical protein